VHIVIHATGLGISVVNAANIVAIMVGVSAAGRIIVGGIGDRIGNKSAMIIAFILMAIALFWLQLAKETWMFYLFAAIFGFSFGGVIALASPIVAELFGLDSHGVIFGIVTFVGQIGNALGPLLAGMIFDATNSYQPAFLICASVSVIGLILTLFLKPISSEKLTDSV
jgi:MFS family permease